MIPRDCIPIGHVPPLPRIDLYGPRKGPADAAGLESFTYSPAYCDHVWKQVRRTAEGTYAPFGGAA
jgi:hypothetical protein